MLLLSSLMLLIVALKCNSAHLRGGDERVPQRVGRDGLADPGAAGGLADHPTGAVPVQPPTVRGNEERPFGALAGRQVDGAGGARVRCPGQDRLFRSGNLRRAAGQLAALIDDTTARLRFGQMIACL